MLNQRPSLPCAAYTGKEPYLFVSYAHADGEGVYPEIKALHERGYRIWYYEGITPGNDWSEELAQAIMGCAMFIVFISRNAIRSNNVKNEIYFALDRRKPFLAIYREEVLLPVGLQLRMNSIQAVLQWRISTDDYFWKIMAVLPDGYLVKKEEEEKVRSSTKLIGESVSDDAAAAPNRSGNLNFSSSQVLLKSSPGRPQPTVDLLVVDPGIAEQWDTPAQNIMVLGRATLAGLPGDGVGVASNRFGNLNLPSNLEIRRPQDFFTAKIVIIDAPMPCRTRPISAALTACDTGKSRLRRCCLKAGDPVVFERRAGAIASGCGCRCRARTEPTGILKSDANIRPIMRWR